jgi:hypothetical protein
VTPGTLNLTIYHGDTYRWTFTLWQDAGKTIPADLTGVVPKAEIRVSSAGGAIITTMDLTVQTPNQILAVLPTAKTALLPKSGGTYDLQLTYPNGDVQTVLSGLVTVTMDVTDSGASIGVLAAPAAPAAPAMPRRPG